MKTNMMRMELTEMASDDNHIGENGDDDSEDNDVDGDDDVDGFFWHPTVKSSRCYLTESLNWSTYVAKVSDKQFYIKI